MRRAAVQVLRSARRPAVRRTIRHRFGSGIFASSPSSTSPASNHALGVRSLITARKERPSSSPAHQVQLLASMQIRKVSVALFSGAIASGAYYMYTGNASPKDNSPVSNAYSTSAATHERKALVVEPSQIYASTIPTEGPLAKETDDYGRKVLEMLTPDQASAKLRKNEESWMVSRGTGVVRYDVVQIPSNDPIEDDHAEKIIDVSSNIAPAESGDASDWMFWGVFDGHSGWTTSAKLRQVLISYVARELNSTYKAAPIPTPDAIDKAIKAGFLALDYEICHESVNKVAKAQSKRLAAEALAPALSGSCALLSFYDSRSKMLRVACTGDSRAVLGRRNQSSGKWVAKALSVDQTGSNRDEEMRMRAEHPGEPEVILHGRVLGNLEPTRAFGDAVYKWSMDVQEKIKAQFFGRTPNRRLKTPPYVTAEPVVTTTKVEPEKGDFVVMATDGLWEMLSNEEVVGLVGQWLEQQAKDKQTSSLKDSWLSSWWSGDKGLPVEKAEVTGEDGQKSPIRQRQWGMDSNAGRFVVQDKNAATHLVRNALGGKDQDQVCALLTLPSPFSRRYRDDLTVEVIFFGDGDNSGTVTLNYEASAAGEEAKPKL